MIHSRFPIKVSGSDFKIPLWDLTLHNCKILAPKFGHNVVCLCTIKNTVGPKHKVLAQPVTTCWL